MSIRKRVVQLKQAVGQVRDEIAMIYYTQMSCQCGQWVETPHSAMILPSILHARVWDK